MEVEMAKRNVKKEALNAVYAVAFEAGLENTTVKRVSERAKTTESNVYYHFDNKEELFECAFFEINKEIDERLRKCYASQNYDVKANLNETAAGIWFEYLNYWIENPEKTFFYDYYSHSHYATDEVWRKQSSSFAFFTALFQSALKSMQNAFDMYSFTLNWSIIIDSAIAIAKRRIKTGTPIEQSTKDNMQKILQNFMIAQIQKDMGNNL